MKKEYQAPNTEFVAFMQSDEVASDDNPLTPSPSVGGGDNPW